MTDPRDLLTHDPPHRRDPSGPRTPTVSLPLPGLGKELGAGDPGPVLQRGACLGRYTVLRALGSGGMGNVYSAYDPELDRRVALKVLRTDLMLSSARDLAHARLRREAQVAARLAHPNVVVIHDVGMVGERLFIAMEEIDGMTLGEWLHVEERPWRDIVKVFLQAGRGLAAAHRAGLVHRDFKPSNVMVDRQDRVKVVDFGLAVASFAGLGSEPGSPTDGLASTASPTRPLGTPAYMSPEQRAGTEIDARSDQFSFCVALYEALFGELPGDAEPGRGRAKVEPAERAVGIPGRIRRAVLRGLAVAPAERYPTLESLLEVLERDPRRRLGGGLTLAFIAALGVVSFVGWRQLEADRELLCKGADRHLASLWDAARKSEIQQAFLATGKPYAAATWNRVEAALDAYSRAWVDLHTESCRATHIHGEQSADMLDLQMTCLDQRLGELRALSEVFAEADSQVVENALVAAEGLTPLRGCADRQALTDRERPAIDPRIADEVERGEARLALARAFEVAGKYQRSLTIAEEARRLGEELAWPRLVAEARLRIGLVQGRLGQLPEMRQSLLGAVAGALATEHSEVLAEALTSLIIHAYLGGELTEAEQWGRLAESALEGRPGMERIAAQRWVFLGLVAQAEKDHDRAIECFQSSMGTNPDLTGMQLSALLTNIGISYQQLGSREEALRFYREAELEVEKSYGSEHPSMGAVLDSQGSVLLELGALDEAAAIYRRSCSIFEKAVGADHPTMAYPLIGLGRTLIAASQAEQARTPLTRAVEVTRQGKGDPLMLALALFELARAERLAGKSFAQTRPQVMEARGILIRLGERAGSELAVVDAWLAEQGRAG